MKNIETAKIYVDAESLFDLRQAILYESKADQKELTDYLISEEHNFRNMDVFPFTSKEDYVHALRTIKMSSLKNATVTHIVNVIITRLEKLEQLNQFNGATKNPEVVLNMYPFILTDKERELIQNFLFVKLNSETIVTVVRLTPKEVTPYFLVSSGFTSCFIYNFSEWMKYHADTLNSCKLEKITMHFAPVFEEKNDEKIFKKLGFNDVFSYTEFLLSGVMQTIFLPMPFYSNLSIAELILDKFKDEIVKTPLKPVEDDTPKSGIIIL